MQEYTSLNEAFDVLGTRPIGSGGYSTVYKVRRHADQQIYALKVLNYTERDKEKVLGDFMSEVALLQRINHSAVVQVVDQLIIGGQPAILMELVEGRSLWELLEEKKYFSAQEVLDLLHDIASGLTACHDMQIPIHEAPSTSDTQLLGEYAIVHNDIHPKNIICVENAEGKKVYKLIDFGLSFTNANSIRNSHRVNGMLEFKSPEKWDPKLGAMSTRSDIYSLGVVLYTLLAGHPPFGWIEDYTSGSQVYEQERRCVAGVIPNLWQARRDFIESQEYTYPSEPDFPYWLNHLVTKCLSLHPKDRFRSGKELWKYVCEGMSGRLPDAWPKEAHTSAPPPLPSPSPPPPPAFPPSEEKQPASFAFTMLSSKVKEMWEKKREKPLRILLVAVLVLSLGGIAYFAGSLWLGRTSEGAALTEKMEGREVIEHYLEIDKEVVADKDIPRLTPYLSFPFSYYGKQMKDEAAFQQHYAEGLRNVRSKQMQVDSIVTVDPLHYIVYRSFSVQKARTLKHFRRKEYFSLNEQHQITSIML